MIEMLLLCVCTLPLSVWLFAELFVSGVSRSPIAFSVVEMLVMVVCIAVVVWTIRLLRGYRKATGISNGYFVSYVLLMVLGSLFSTLLLLSNLVVVYPGYSKNMFWVVGLGFLGIACLGVLSLWREKK